MLHIHNGDSTANTLKEFGWPGEHIAFNEVLMAGPTPHGLSPDQWMELRTKFLTEAYELKIEDCQKDLLEQEAALRGFSEHDETILWFEHDLFCQINLIYLLNWFSKQAMGRTTLSLICVSEFAGVEDFRGLGQLTGEQLASLFDGRHEVSELELNTATRAWEAYCSPSPEQITVLLGERTSALPYLPNALRLHLTRFPSVTNGLGRHQSKALELMSDGAIGFKSLFLRFAKAEPVYGMGDSQFWCELKRLAKARLPLITITGTSGDKRAFESNRYQDASLELTEIGSRVLASPISLSLTG